jgi:hypothetical protein
MFRLLPRGEEKWRWATPSSPPAFAFSYGGSALSREGERRSNYFLPFFAALASITACAAARRAIGTRYGLQET